MDVEQRIIIDKHNWKDFNKAELDNVLETPTWQRIVDPTKDLERNWEMYNNIVRLSRDYDVRAVIVVVTGSGHIPFFRNQFIDARFPLS